MWIVLRTPWARGNGKNINLSGQDLDRTGVYARGKISLIPILTKILLKKTKHKTDPTQDKKRSRMIEVSWEKSGESVAAEKHASLNLYFAYHGPQR